MNKREPYFKKPKSKIVKDVLSVLAFAGIVAVAATSPFFIVNIVNEFGRLKKYPRKKVYNTFYNLRERGFVNFYEKNNQIYISLTKKGRQKAGWMQIDDLEIKKSEKWDGNWRILSFDIAEKKRIYREALRGKLIELGFKLYQKSAWVIPYDCKNEMVLLKSFFGLSDREVKLIVANNIGEDQEFKRMFKLN